MNKSKQYIGAQYKCRTCFDPGRNLYALADMCNNNSKKTWRDILNHVGQIKTNDAEVAPKTLCCKCLDKLIRSYNFLLQIQNVNRMYSQLLTSGKDVAQNTSSNNFRSFIDCFAESAITFPMTQKVSEIKLENEQILNYDITLNNTKRSTETSDISENEDSYDLFNEALNENNEFPNEQPEDQARTLNNEVKLQRNYNTDRKFENSSTSSDESVYLPEKRTKRHKINFPSVNTCVGPATRTLQTSFAAKSKHMMDTSLMITSTEDEQLYNLLLSWHLESLYHTLRDNEIFVPVLKVVKLQQLPTFLKDVSAGKAILFEDNLEKWRNSQNIPISAQACEIENASKSTSETESVCILSRTIDLETILTNTKNGQMLVEYYNRFNFFKEQQRSLLISVIGNYIYENNIQFNLRESYNVEKQIIKKFPTEKIEFYRTSKRGRLYAKISNMKCAQKLKGLFKETNSDEQAEQQQIYDPEPYAESVQQILRYAELSVEEFENYWVKCSNLRFKEMSENCVTEIFKRWPQYEKQSGVRLIEIDFNTKTGAKDFLPKWALYVEKLEQILKKRLPKQSNSFSNFQSINDDTSEDSKNLMILWCLHNILKPSPVQVVLENGKKMRQTFTVSESQNAFALIAETHEAIEEKIRIYKNNSKDLPCLLIIGNLHNIEEIFVFFHKIRYSFSSVLKALDICFKIYFTFDLKYPKQAETFWIFIEKFFYELKRSKINPKIAILSNEIENI